MTTDANAASPAGSYPITVSGLVSGNYAISYVLGALTVTKAPLTVTADNLTRPYGSLNPPLTLHYSPFANGESPTVLTGALLVETTALPPSAPGDYPITPSGLTSDNYAIAYVAGTLAVTKAPLTVTADNQSRPYATPNGELTVQFSGFVLAQDKTVLGGELSVITTAVTASPAGDYPITPSGLTSANYTLVYVNGALTVTPVPLLVKADNKTRVYGGSNPALTVAYEGLVNGDVSGSLGGTLSVTTDANAASPAGSYPITVSGLVSGNYAISFGPGSLTVTKAPLTITADNQSRPYATPNGELTVQFTGFLLAQDKTVLGGVLSVLTTAVTASPAGDYPITPSGLTSDNYAITYLPGTLTISRLILTVTADNQSRAYGGPNPSLAVQYAGFATGEGVSALGGTLDVVTAPLSSAVGSYPIVPSGLTSGNYTLVYVSGTLTVTPVPLLVKADNQTRVYGASNPALAVAYEASSIVNTTFLSV